MPLPSGSALGMVAALPTALQRINPSAATMGISAIVFLIFARTGLPPILNMLGVAPRVGAMLSRLAPMLAIIVATTYCAMNQIDQTAQVSIVGAVPSGLPALALPSIHINALQALALPALLISLVGFVESVSVAQSLALKRGERISPNKELMGIGVANVASAVSGGFPVTGGFARSVVNYDAGAHSPGAGIVSAIIMSVVIVALTGWFYYLPHAVLAATIIVAVLTLVDFKTVITTWRYDKADAVAMLLTFAGVLLLGVEEGILLGVVLSLAVLVWRSSHPHMAVVGRVPNTEHFRNIDRHEVATLPGLIALRVDESLYFANAQIVEAKIEQLVQEQPKTRCVLLIMSAVNQLDTTALQMLTELEASLSARGIRLQFAEVKGPVLDKLQFSALGQRMRERIFLSTHQAFNAFANEKAMH
jgi:SulP family sulfate permease